MSRPSPELRSSRPRRALSAAWCAAVTSLGGCVSTDFAEAGTSTLACARRSDEAESVGSLVLVRDVSGSAPRVCSGVALAPTLVMTHLNCAVQYPQGPALPLPETADAVCDPRTGRPVDDGSFLASARVLADPNQVSVSIPSSGGSAVRASSILASEPTSVCADNLALLILNEPLDLPGSPVRLDDTSRIGERVTLSGFRLAEGPYQRRELSSTIEEITFEAGAQSTPPRSLRLTQQICDHDLGGAVISPESGALLGMITSKVGEGCDAPQGQTLALQLAPFRQLLLEAADAALANLQVELPSPSVSQGRLRECDAH